MELSKLYELMLLWGIIGFKGLDVWIKFTIVLFWLFKVVMYFGFKDRCPRCAVPDVNITV